MNKKEKEKYKKELLKNKQENYEMLSEIYNESKEVELGVAQDLGDKAESSYTKEFLLNLSNAEREQLFMIDEALKRIKRCTFGDCQSCGKAITKKRLNAIPWTPYCIHCQQKEEEESS